MYFMNEGSIGVCFSLISEGILKKQYHVAKKLQCGEKFSTIICDHYILNQCKSQFIYMALHKNATCLALKKKFLYTEVFPKYKEILLRLQTSSYKNYKKHIHNPVNKEKKLQIGILNKKSVYQNIQLGEKPADFKPSPSCRGWSTIENKSDK